MIFKKFFYALLVSTMILPYVPLSGKSSCLGCVKYVDNNGVSIAYTRTGNKNCPAIVFIPGFVLSGEEFICQCQQLSPYYQVVTVDLRGFGRSDQSATLPMSYANWVSDVTAVINTLGLQNPIIAGFSIGSIVAELYAATNSNISKLILMSPYDGQFINTPNAVCPACPVYSNGVPLAALLPLLALLPDTTAFAAAGAQILVPETCSAADRVRAYVAAIIAESSVASINNVVNSGVLFTGVTALLPSISVPTLILNGANDPLMNQAGLLALRQAIPNSRQMEFPGGHLFNITQSSEVNRAIFKFITENPACCDVCCL
jgi:non-heme chloroperoxidase